MGKCQVFTLSLCRQTDNGKAICPPILQYGGIKRLVNTDLDSQVSVCYPHYVDHVPNKVKITVPKGDFTFQLVPSGHRDNQDKTSCKFRTDFVPKFEFP